MLMKAAQWLVDSLFSDLGACRVVIALIAYEFMLYERTRISLGSIGIRHTPITPILIYMVALNHAS